MRKTRPARGSVLFGPLIAPLVLALSAVAEPGQPAARLEQLQLLKLIPLKGTLHHVQGIAVERDRLWVTSVDSKARKGYLHLFRLSSGELLKEVEVQEGERFHPGGISLDGPAIWVPVAEYRRGGKTTIQRRHKETLGLLGSFEVDDHIGCLAAGGQRLVGGNWDSRQIYYWNRKGKLLDKKENPAGTRYQDMKMAGGTLIASGVLSGDDGAIDWLDLRTLELRKRITAGKTDWGVRYTNEGMAVGGGRLYLLPEDGPSRLFVFALPR